MLGNSPSCLEGIFSELPLNGVLGSSEAMQDGIPTEFLLRVLLAWFAVERGTQRRIMADPQKNKQTVLAYIETAFNDRRPAEAVEKYGGSHYIQHNPQVPDGFEAFIQFVTGFTTQFPQLSLDIKRAVAEGDLVVTHSLLKTSPEDRGTALADFFRLEDGKIVEHWDVLQPVPESAANDHPMF
jgi:predicted SnoaL-like aldol condensation-catalyzing enzyme